MSEEGDKKTDHKKVWGHGFRTGLKKAMKVQEENNMTAMKLQRTLEGQTATARKVFDLLDINNGQTLHQIIMKSNLEGRRFSQNQLLGILHSLKSDGLATLKHERWRRVVIPQKPEKVPMLQPHEEEDVPHKMMSVEDVERNAANESDPMSVLADLAEDMRRLADRFDSAALEIEEHIRKRNETVEMAEQFVDFIDRFKKRD